MNNQILELANQAALYANQHSGADCVQGPYWITVFTEKYTELLVKDLDRFFNKDMSARLAYELICRNYNV